MKKKKQLKYKAKIGAEDFKKYKDFGGCLIVFLGGYILKFFSVIDVFITNDIMNSDNEVLHQATYVITILSFIISFAIIVCFFINAKQAYYLINILTLMFIIFNLIIALIIHTQPSHIDLVTYYAGEIAFALGQSLFHVIFLLYLRFSNRVKVYYRLIT